MKSYKKFDLHIHTSASECFIDIYENDKLAAAAIVKEAIKKELVGIAITDHNTGKMIDIVKEAAKGTVLTVYPGVEITAGDAHSHIIALLDVDRTGKDIEDLLMALGIPHTDRGKSNAFSKMSIVDVIDKICGEPFNGLAVPAHVDSTNGIIDQMKGEPRIKVIQHPKLLAVEANDYNKTCKYLDGNDPYYKRKLAIYQSSDNPCLDQKGMLSTSGNNSGKHSIAGIGFRHTYFNVDEKPNLESLRQCFIDPEVRIRQSWEFKKNVYPHIKSVKINSGYLTGLEATFHPGLNSILGAKGVGKSLLIEYIRFALDQEPSQQEIKDDHDKKLSNQLGQYGEIQVLVSDESGKEFLIKRTFEPTADNPIQCIDLMKGGTIDVNISKLFPILCLSQNEIIKIAEDKKDQQMQFIDKFFDFHSYREQIILIEKDLEGLDQEFASAIRALHESKKLSMQKETASIELSRLSQQLKNPIFTEIAKYEEKDRTFRKHKEYLTNLNGHLIYLVQKISGERIPILDNDLSIDPSLKRNIDVLGKTQSYILDNLDLQKAEIQKSLQLIENEYNKWLPDYQKKKDELKETVLELGGSVKVLEQSRKTKTAEIENIDKRLSAISGTKSQIGQVSKRRNEKLQELKRIYTSYFLERKSKCEYFEKCSNGNLKIEIVESSNRDEFKKRLLSLKRGSYLRDFKIEQLCDKITPNDFVLKLLRYDVAKIDKPEEASSQIKSISESVDLPIEGIKALCDYLLQLIYNQELKYEDLLKLQYKAYPEDRPIIRYNIGDYKNPKYEPLDKISTGQKCTAMIILALSDSKMPIVIDQPEDSLDIKSIWQDMCQKIRGGKQKRQFLFTTHNSSIAVASDTDEFLIMSGTASKGEIVFAGTVDNEKIRKEVIDYLEGGINTYKLKYLKYNMPKDIHE